MSEQWTLDQAASAGALTLVIAPRTTAKEPRGFRLAMHADVTDEIRDVCAATVDAIRSREAVVYETDLDFDHESQYLFVANHSMVVHRTDQGRRGADGAAHPIQVETSAAARRLLARASSLPQLDAGQLKRQSFLFYAAVVGDDPDKRTAFVAHWNPYKASLSGHLLTSFGDRLRRVEGPLLVFKKTFDIVVSPSGIAVLDSAAFEAVFRDVDTMRERIPTWSGHVVDALPLEPETANRLHAACLRSPRLARQARSIFERNQLAGRQLELPALADELERWGVDRAEAVKDGALTLTDTEIVTLFKLLDERLYEGWHSGTGWEAATRSRRRG